VQRILVAGISGVGKTTMAVAVAQKLGLSYHELDALFHGPGWVARTDFKSDVQVIAEGPQWVCDGQYHRFLGDLLWERADTLLWVDLPRRVVMWRVVRRSLVRVALRRTLWNGNRESWRSLLFSPNHPVRWAWSHHAAQRRELAERVARHQHLTVVRLTSTREARRWRRALEASKDGD